MPAFFSRFSGKDRNSTSPQPSAAEVFKAQHMSGMPGSPESSSTLTSSTSSSQIPSPASSRLNTSTSSTTTAPKLVLTAASPIQDDTSPSTLTTPSENNNPTTTTTDGNSGSVKKKHTLANIPIPPSTINSATIQSDADLSDLATPIASQNGHKIIPLVAPELVVQSEDSSTTHQPEAQGVSSSRHSSLASLSLRRKGSKAAIKDSTGTMPSSQGEQSQSRRGSVASSEAGSLSRNDTLTPSAHAVLVPPEGAGAGESGNTSVSLGRTPSAPASGLLSAPTFDGDNVSIRSASGRKRRLWSNSTGNEKKKTMPTGGIAGALAQSGMSLAGMASPPLPQSSPPRRTASKSGHVPRTSIDSVLNPRRGSVTAGNYHHSQHVSQSADEYNPAEDDDDVYDSPDALSFDDDMPVTGFAVASSRRNQDFHELFPNIEPGDYLIEGVFVFLLQSTALSPTFHNVFRLWLCNATGYSRSRSTIHIREPLVFPCEHFWMGH